jgi:hypothetical protein
MSKNFFTQLSTNSLHFNFQLILFLPIIFWIISKWIFSNSDSFGFNETFGFSIALISIVGAGVSFYRAGQWGGSKSSVGNSLTFLGVGLLMWSLGQSSLMIDQKLYSPLDIYDFFFIFIDPMYLLSAFYLAKSVGVFKKLAQNLYLIIIPITISIINYLIVINFKQTSILQPFSDINLSMKDLNIEILYIFGSVFLASLVMTILIFSYEKLGGIFRKSLILIFLGLIAQFIGDNLFDLFPEMSSIGSLADFFFYLSIFLITSGAINLSPEYLKDEK